MAREMKDSGIEWIGEIPKEWEVIPHKYIMHKQKDICEHYNNEDIISLTMAGVIVRDLSAGGKMPTTFDGYQFVEPDNLLMCLFDIDVTPRCVGVVKNYGITSPAYSRFIMHEGYYNRYYDYLLRAIDDDKVFVHLSKNLRSSLTETDFGAIKSISPPYIEQQRIADFLDKKCAEIDSVISQTEKTIEEYKALKQSVITEAVTKGVRGSRPMKDSGIEWIGEIPKEWEVVKGKYIFCERSERGNKKNLQLLSPTQKFGVIPQALYEKLTGMKAVKLEDKTDFNTLKSIYSGDFCISLRSFQGGFEYSLYNGVVSPAYHVFFPTCKICDSYYKYFFKDKGFIDKMASLTKTFRDGKSISFTDFGNSLIPVPSLPEQQRIADFLDKKCAEIDKLIEAKQQLLTEMESYKKSVIYEYVTGKKEV